jgi:hypothetical protein
MTIEARGRGEVGDESDTSPAARSVTQGGGKSRRRDFA